MSALALPPRALGAELPPVTRLAHAVRLAPADAHQAAHRARVGRLAEGLALRLCLDAHSARQLRLAAPLHDIGVLDTPGRAPSPADIPRRAQRGSALLADSRLPLFALAAQITRHLHERWDGSGGPDGLRGEAIPLAARIVAVADCFDTLARPRAYRPTRADDLALAMLAAQAGSAFDPALVAVFAAHAAALIALCDQGEPR